MKIECGKWYVTESPKCPGRWRAECVDDSVNPEGIWHVALFCGPQAEALAREYAGWKNSALAGYQRAA